MAGVCSCCGNSHFELKCLPCSHDICTECLEDRSQQLSNSICCPIDKQDFALSNDGIDSLPTKGLLVEVLNNFQTFPGDENENKTVINNFASANNNYRQKLVLSLKRQENSVKANIRRVSQELVEAIMAKEQELCKDAETWFESEKQMRLSQLEDSGIEADIDGFTRHKRQGTNHRFIARSNSARGKITTDVYHGNTSLTSLNTLSFKVNKEYIHDVLNKSIGKLEVRKDYSSPSTQQMLGKRQQSYPSRPGKVLYSLELPISVLKKFRPWAVAVSESGYIAVVDRGNNCVHIFNPSSNFLRHVCYGAHGRGLEVYGVTFLSHDTLATAEYSPVTGSGKLLWLNMSGEPLSVIGRLKGPAHITSYAVKSNTINKIIAVYYMSRLESAEVFTIDEGNSELPSDRSEIKNLVHPQKCVILDDKFLVSDTDAGKNQGCVKVLNSSGELTHSFGEHRLWNSTGLGYPLRIAADPVNCSILVYHSSSGRVVVYDNNGIRQSGFDTIPGLLDFTVSPDRKLIATCGDRGKYPNTLFVLSYS